MKKKIVIACIIFAVVGVFMLPILAAGTHALMLRDLSRITWNLLSNWMLIFQDERIRTFYFLYLAAAALGLLWVLLNGNYLKYRSDMQVVTPDIITPRSDGQGQFGTARWLPKEQIGRFFAVWKVPGKDEWFRELMAAGEADRKEIENAKNIKID